MPAWNPNDYETVDTRIHRFYEAFPNGRIISDLVQVYEKDGRVTQYVVKAYAYRDLGDLEPSATGYAEEIVGSSPVNRTSALENCETSAIGRALANLGLSPKGSRPSIEEMEKAERTKASKAQAAAPKPSRDVLDEYAKRLNASTNLDDLDLLAVEISGLAISQTDRDVFRDIYIKRKNYLAGGAK